MEQIIEITRIAITVAFFAYASWSDSKTREVSNRVWVLLAPPVFALTLAQLLIYESSSQLSYGLTIGLTVVVAILLFYAGGFGGADAKALICLALALPFFPKSLPIPVSGQLSPISKMFFPITVFSNAVILVIIPVLWIVARNVSWRLRKGKELFEADHKKESLSKRILVLATGYRVPITRLKENWHVYPLEDIEEKANGDPIRTLVVLPKEKNRTAIVDRLENSIRKGIIEDQIWASPGLPMLVLITLGLLAALFFGDIIWILITFFLG